MADQLATTAAPVTAQEVRRSVLLRQGEAEFVLEFIEKSDRVRSQFADRWDEILDNYLVVPFGGNRLGRFPRNELGRAFSPRHRSMLADPETHQIVETLSSQAIDLILGQKDYITAVPKGSDDKVKAESIAKILQAVLEMDDVYETHWTLIKDAFIFGTAIMEVGWETRARAQVMDGMPVEMIYRDRPLVRQVDIYDFYPDPSGTRIHGDMLGCAKRFRIPQHQAEQLARAGVYEPAAVQAAIKAKAGGKRKTNSGQMYFGGEERLSELSKDTSSKFNMLGGFEYYGEAPLGYGSGMTNRVITVLEGEVVRSSINPYEDGRIPFVQFTINPVQGRFYGLGPAEVVRFLQDSSNNNLMAFNDAVNLMVQPGWLIGRTFGGDKSQLRNPDFMQMIDCRDPAAVQPIPRDFGVIQVAAQNWMRNKTTMREASGAANPLQAIEGGDRQTATEISTLTKFASQRIVMMASFIERGSLPMEGKMIMSRLRQFAPRGGVYYATLHGEPLEIPVEEIDMDADIRFGGSRQMQNKFMAVNAKRELLNIIGTHAENLDVVQPLVENIADEMEIVNGKEMVAEMVRRLAAKQQAQMMMQQQQEAQEAAVKNLPRQREAQSGSEAGAMEMQGQAIQ